MTVAEYNERAVREGTRLHGSTRCHVCGGKHDGLNLVRRDIDGSFVHILCQGMSLADDWVEVG